MKTASFIPSDNLYPPPSNENGEGTLLSTAYLAPIQWYTKLLTYPEARIDVHEHYVKQTYRNRCRILMPDGPTDLVLPVEAASTHTPICDLRISEHGAWRHHHWNALRTAYGNSPFFEYYADDLAPFYERRIPFLVDFNEGLRATICQLIDIETPIHLTSSYVPVAANDCRALISPKQSLKADDDFRAAPYYQVFAQRLGFQPNLSIVDLLFNMGPESILTLHASLGLGQD